MLELPESHTLAMQLTKAVAGKRVEHVTANASPHGFAFFTGDPADYPSLLEGKRLGEARAVGGMAELCLEDTRLLLGDGVNFRLIPAGEKRPLKHQLCMELEDGSALTATIQMYGGIWAYRTGENDNPYYQVALEKPTPFTDAFDEGYFARLFTGLKPSASVKALLATEQRIPGLGNGVLQDILFHAGLLPQAKVSGLSSERTERLFRCVKDTLRQMTVAGGRDTEKDLFGKPGGYRTILSKNALKSPCPKCGGEIVRKSYMGGNVYFCPQCQIQ